VDRLHVTHVHAACKHISLSVLIVRTIHESLGPWAY
jgi:hypothetical protein